MEPTAPDSPQLAEQAAGWRSAYVHIPFCRRRCPYCDFAVVAYDEIDGGHDESIERYVDALVTEIEMEPTWERLDAVNLGGGTPSTLGTGQLTRGLPFAEVKNWGAARWAQPLFSLMCDGDAVVVDHQMREILPPGPNGERRYYRLQPLLINGSDDMDDASVENIAAVKALALETVEKNRDTLRQLAAKLTAGDLAEVS